MKEKIKNQKGFIQIPLLVAIILASISAASVGTGVVLFKQQITPIFTASMSDAIYRTFYEKKFEAGQLKQELELSKFREKESEQKAEEELTKRVEAEGERKEAEEKARQEAIKRSQEEMLRKSKEQELAAKEVQEKTMNTDSDGDSLTYRRELELGTSDWNTDSDGDGVADNLDLHPTGEGRNLAQDFQWTYEQRKWEYTISIPEDWYEYYKNKSRIPHGLEYVTFDDPYIKKIAQKIKTTAEINGYHTTSFLLSFIQSLPYVADSYTRFDEYPKYPIETIIDRNGDCEDTAYLFTSLARAMGVGAALIEFSNHMGSGVKTAHSQIGYYYPIGEEWYYYYETTGEGWEIGDLPDEYRYQTAKVMVAEGEGSQFVYPQHVKPCEYSSDFFAYFDGVNFYTDSQCSDLAYCLPYREYYVKPPSIVFYWDRNCTQKVVAGCSKSIYYPGYFFSSLTSEYYTDYQCTFWADPY